MSRVLRTLCKWPARPRATRWWARPSITPTSSHVTMSRRHAPVNHPARTWYRSSPLKNNNTSRTSSEHSHVSKTYHISCSCHCQWVTQASNRRRKNGTRKIFTDFQYNSRGIFGARTITIFICQMLDSRGASAHQSWSEKKTKKKQKTVMAAS